MGPTDIKSTRPSKPETTSKSDCFITKTVKKPSQSMPTENLIGYKPFIRTVQTTKKPQITQPVGTKPVSKVTGIKIIPRTGQEASQMISSDTLKQMLIMGASKNLPQVMATKVQQPNPRSTPVSQSSTGLVMRQAKKVSATVVAEKDSPLKKKVKIGDLGMATLEPATMYLQTDSTMVRPSLPQVITASLASRAQSNPTRMVPQPRLSQFASKTDKTQPVYKPPEKEDLSYEVVVVSSSSEDESSDASSDSNN